MTFEIPADLYRRLCWRPWNLNPQVGDTRCQACHGENPVWFVANEVWNAVMGDEGGILCPTCFMIVAEHRGAVNDDVIWRLERH